MSVRRRVVRPLLVAMLTALVCAAGTSRSLAQEDLWRHPRREGYDPQIHYRDAGGELYYKHENDLQLGLGPITARGGPRPRISVKLGPDLFELLSRRGGRLEPVLRYDRNGDGRIDRHLLGRVEGREAIFDSPELIEIDLRESDWQIGVRYRGGDASLEGRYLASTVSSEAQLTVIPWPELPEVGTAALPEGLVILKHREGAPFDLRGFMERPAAYLADFDTLTREGDGDDWTAEEPAGPLPLLLRFSDVQEPTPRTRRSRVTTHFGREDLYLVRIKGEFALEVEWGDVPLEEYFEEYLDVAVNADGCYSSLESRLENDDAARTVVPHRLLYCPGASLALFDAPDGYEIGLSAVTPNGVHEHTELATSIRDNFRLYLKEIYPRRPSSRGTGRIGGNIEAGLHAAGADVRDALRHLLPGAHHENIHTGQVLYQPSPLTMLPIAVWELLQVEPAHALGTLVEGVQSGLEAGADLTSALSNGVLNTASQLVVGLTGSPDRADRVGDYAGALVLALARNLPGTERSTDALSPLAAWRHDRAFEPARYTRTDTQLNLDRAFTLIDLQLLRAIDEHNEDSDDPAPADESGSGDTGSAGQPAGPDGASSEAGGHSPESGHPSKAKPGKGKHGEAKHAKRKHGKSKHHKAKHPEAKHSKAKHGKVEPGSSKHTHARHGRPKHHGAKPHKARQGMEPGKAEHARAKHGEARFEKAHGRHDRNHRRRDGQARGPHTSEGHGHEGAERGEHPHRAHDLDRERPREREVAGADAEPHPPEHRRERAELRDEPGDADGERYERAETVAHEALRRAAELARALIGL